MKTSVVMPAWILNDETLKITRACIDSLRAGGDFEFVLIDNGGTLGGGYLRSEANIYIKFDVNRGYTPAVNAGIQLATGDIIAVANNDIRVPPNWETVCREILENNPEVATVHPRMQTYTEPFNLGDLVAIGGRERWCGFSFWVTSRTFLNRMRQAEEGKEPYPGLMDENYGKGGGGDDWDWVHRERMYGKQCYTNKTAFQHLDSFTLRQMGAERQKVADQNDAYFTEKWGIKKEELGRKELGSQYDENWRKGFL
jgi:glycosyltransferase involved in cell wall biosynthesis